MNIHPILLLSVGAAFALIYALIIIFGWAKTRKNRKIIQELTALTLLPVYHLPDDKVDGRLREKSFSLTQNRFTAPDGTILDPAQYSVFVARGSSPRYPAIESGDIIFIRPDTGKIAYAFTVPKLNDYR